MPIKWISSVLAALLLGAAGASSATFQEQCLSFSPQTSIFNSTLTVRQHVPAGGMVNLSDLDPSCARPFQNVSAEFCRIALHIPTTNRSSITMELWLPENWEAGRTLASGNGGIDGCIEYENLAYGVENGMVAMGANNGHNGTGGQAFLNNPDIITDFSWRSLHTTVTLGKRLAQAFYSEPIGKSYYMGCSLGGRQGIHSAERFPTDFDGILAGSPAVDFNNLYAWRATFYIKTGKFNSTNFIDAATWTNLIHPEVLNQCDLLDHAADGIIEDPTLCVFRPEALLCADGKTPPACLTPPQVDIVNSILSPFFGSHGQLIYPAMQPGNELVAATALYDGMPWQLSQDWYRYVLLNDPTWDQATFTLADAELADEVNPAHIRTFPSNLTTFKSMGGKIVTYHGQQDNQISCFNSNRFYNHLSRGMSASSDDMDEFYRFFRISGMFHCLGGPGAWEVGQSGNPAGEQTGAAAGIGFHPESNALAALIAWVENGTAPETLTGTKFVNDDPKQGVSFTRRHCRFPRRNTFMGGNSSDPDNWECLFPTS